MLALSLVAADQKGIVCVHTSRSGRSRRRRVMIISTRLATDGEGKPV